METVNPVNPNGKKLLKEIRKELNLTQSKMAERLGLRQERIAEIETGKRTPEWLIRAIELQKLLKEAGYSLEDLSISDEN